MDLLNVFVSRPTWVENEFEKGLANFLTRIEDLGLKGRTIGVTDQPTKAPLDEVINLLDECRGAVILGYPQIKFPNGYVKDSRVENIQLATEWNHIEAGLAYARELPLLVIHHNNVIRGIFDRGASNSFIHKLDLSDDSWALDPKMTKTLKKWRNRCLIRDEEEKNRLAKLDKVNENKFGAEVIVTLISEPRILKSGNKYKVCIKNNGPEDAKNITIDFPDGNDPIIKSEYDSKLPINNLPAGIEYNLIAAVNYDIHPPFNAKLKWKIVKANNHENFH
jgi:hypothetical protein